MALIPEILNGFQEFITKGASVINTDHSSIHKGIGVLTRDYLDLAGSAVQEYCLTTHDGDYIHFKNLTVKTLGSSVKVSIIKNATITDNTGDILPVNNPNDVSTRIPKSEIRKNPVYTGGEEWEYVVALADSTNQSVGVTSISQSVNEELVMPPGESYIIRIEELKGDPAEVFWRAFFYEEPEGVV